MADTVPLARLLIYHGVGFGVARFVQSAFTCILLASLLTDPVNLLLPRPYHRTFLGLLTLGGWIQYRLHHVAFWDRNNDGIITTFDIYTGFRDLGFCVLFSLGGLLINLFFSYPTHLGHSYLPDPLFRIYIDSIHKAKHGSDSGVYDSDGNLRLKLFDDMFDKLDTTGTGSLGVKDLLRLISRNRVAADPAGWSFAFMEWWTTWLLLQKKGRVWKEDLRQAYDGTLFWRIRDKHMEEKGWQQGYGWNQFTQSMWANGTWKEWELGPGAHLNTVAQLDTSAQQEP